MRTPSYALLIAVLMGGAHSLRAQDTTRARPDSTSAAARPAAAAATALDFSGVLFLNFQSGGNRTQRRQSSANRFELERAYLTFRMPAGERMSMRITADVFQQRDSTRDSYYGGWAFRAKYAYAQYDYIAGTGTALRAVARLGMLQTPIVEHEEQFWPRGLLNTAVEMNGFFASSDIGLSTLVTLPNRSGEVYATLVNGNGYQSRETDRFKDYGGRLTLTPFANGTSALRTLAITPWYYKGAKGSDFARGPGSVLPVGDALKKDRAGLHLGVRDPRLTIGTQLALRMEEYESVTDTTTTLVPTRVSRTGTLVSAYTIFKPLALLGGSATSAVNAVFRFDNVKPDRDLSARSTFVVAGLGYDLNRKSSLWIDFQTQDAHGGSTATDLKTLFVHAIVAF